jgi:hypothetical protein
MPMALPIRIVGKRTVAQKYEATTLRELVVPRIDTDSVKTVRPTPRRERWAALHLGGRRQRQAVHGQVEYDRHSGPYR